MKNFFAPLYATVSDDTTLADPDLIASEVSNLRRAPIRHHLNFLSESNVLPKRKYNFFCITSFHRRPQELVSASLSIA
jgi:hypothetical protein